MMWRPTTIALWITVITASSCGDDAARIRIEGTTPGDCSDGADNDADGLFDCADSSCTGAPACAGSDADVMDAGGVVRDAGSAPDGAPDARSIDAGSGRDAAVGFDAAMRDDDLPPVSIGTPTMPMMGPADYSCRGTRTAPTAGAAVPVTFELREFRAGTGLAGVQVWFFASGTIADVCVPPACTEVVTDAAGDIDVMLASRSWFGYRVLARMGATAATTVTPAIRVQARAPAGAGSLTGDALSRSTLNLVPTVLGFRMAPGSGSVIGLVTDCAGRPVAGARAIVFDPDGAEVLEGDAMPDPHYRYLNGDRFPSPTAEFTDVDGFTWVLNVPVTAGETRTYRVEIWGRTAAGSPSLMLGCEETPLRSDVTSLLEIGPLRADAPASCGT